MNAKDLAGIKVSDLFTKPERDMHDEAAKEVLKDVVIKGTGMMKVIWPDPKTMRFTTERRDPYSTLSDEQHERRAKNKSKA